jgi:hypothetical protein
MRDPMDALESVLIKYPRLWAKYIKWNFCKADLADGTSKKDSWLFDLYYKVFYLDCACCAALRGILFGLVVGLALGWLGRAICP